MQNAFVRFQMKAYLFYHAQQALSRTFLTFFEAFQLQTSFSQFFRNFLSRFAILPDSLFIIPHPDSLVNIFFHPLKSFFCPRRRPSRCSLISIRHSHPLVNSFFTNLQNIFLALFFFPAKHCTFPHKMLYCMQGKQKMRQPQSATNTLRPAQVIPHHTQRHIAAPLSSLYGIFGKSTRFCPIDMRFPKIYLQRGGLCLLCAFSHTLV